MKEKMQEAINEQINAEIYSAYLYYSMASYFESLSLKGFAHWMRLQVLEELTHAQKFTAFAHDRGAKVVMRQVEGPPSEWASPLEAFESTYRHEQEVTSRINRLVDLALKESDHATYNFLQWFVGEQVEEEASADEIVQKLKLVGKAEGGLFLVDQELSQRAFTPPPDLKL
jgi:ferritin